MSGTNSCEVILNYCQRPIRFQKGENAGGFTDGKNMVVCTFGSSNLYHRKRGLTSGPLLARSHKINFCHIIKSLSSLGSRTVPLTKPYNLLTNPQCGYRPAPCCRSTTLTTWTLAECADCDGNLSTCITSRC